MHPWMAKHSHWPVDVASGKAFDGAWRHAWLHIMNLSHSVVPPQATLGWQSATADGPRHSGSAAVGSRPLTQI